MTFDLLNSNEYQNILLFVCVLLLPKLLLRFRIPIGISSLILGKSFLKSSILTLAGAYLLSLWLNIDMRAAIILSIGLFTPSAGFILNSMMAFKFSPHQQKWIRTKSISKEIAAVAILFFTLQSQDMILFFKSIFVILFLIIILPHIFQFFLMVIAPYAPRSEASFLILVAFVTGIITKKMGTYYLVGAFIAGIAAGQFKHFIKSKESNHISSSISVFFSIFIPFYFFNAGAQLNHSYFTYAGLKYGLIFSIVIIPIRVLCTTAGINDFIRDFKKDRYRLALSIIPNLIFGLVMANILHEHFSTSPDIISSLLFYTIFSSLIPTFVFKKAPPEAFDTSRI